MEERKSTVQGERWFPADETFSEEMKKLWGDWYCDSETGKLRSVLMHRPGSEIKQTAENYNKYRFRGIMDPVRAGEEHDRLADIYRTHGVEVHYVQKQRKDRPNALFVRDLMLMTPEGAVLSRPATELRRGEEKAVSRTLGALGVPIIKTINGSGFFEGANVMWVDRRTAVLGTGSRTNEAGALQVENELKNIGVEEVIRTPVPYGSIHLDGFMNMADARKMVVFPWHLSYDTAKILMDRGIEIIELTNIEEVKEGMALNFTALEPGKVVMPAGCPESRKILENNGVEVVETEINELLKGWGAVHCMTGVLKREPV